MIVIVIILLFLLWWFSLSSSSGGETPHVAKLDQIKAGLDQICADAKIFFGTRPYSLIESKTTSFVQHPESVFDLLETGPSIHLVLSDAQGRLYDDNTLYRVALHEMAHILCPVEGHPPIFDSIEAHLLSLALARKMIIENTEIDAEYPCIDQDENSD